MPPRVDALRPKLKHWADLLASGQANTLKEQEILPDFLFDSSVGLLGYTRPAVGGPFRTFSGPDGVTTGVSKVPAEASPLSALMLVAEDMTLDRANWLAEVRAEPTR